MAMMIRGALGLNPWDVLHQGVTRHIPLSFGAVVAVVGVLVLLAWIPLRQKPGLGTFANVAVLAMAVDVGLATIAPPEHLSSRSALLVAGIVLNGIAGALYIGAQFGPGPRDGLMTGLAERTGASIRLVRTAIEISVLGVGFLLGGTVGIGTVAYAVGIGPLTQFFLRYTVVDIRPASDRAAAVDAAEPRGHVGVPAGAVRSVEISAAPRPRRLRLGGSLRSDR
ncbi:YczE/YyaS/YitT family protein [Millisia brevis]|uniref:membrane protein YczE n=1 Tax=Millisia brevis TaxID=264148 RepID=UPI001FDF2283|nr:hypothetical protein [Millisia brevis]